MSNKEKENWEGKQKKQEEKRVATENAVNKIFCPQIMKNLSPAHSQTTKAEILHQKLLRILVVLLL